MGVFVHSCGFTRLQQIVKRTELREPDYRFPMCRVDILIMRSASPLFFLFVLLLGRLPLMSGILLPVLTEVSMAVLLEQIDRNKDL